MSRTDTELDNEHAERLELLELGAALDEQRARRVAEVRAALWCVGVMHAAAEELRRPAPTEPIDAADACLEHIKAGLDEVVAAGSDAREYLEERLRVGLDSMRPNHSRMRRRS